MNSSCKTSLSFLVALLSPFVISQAHASDGSSLKALVCEDYLQSIVSIDYTSVARPDQTSDTQSSYYLTIVPAFASDEHLVRFLDEIMDFGVNNSLTVRAKTALRQIRGDLLTGKVEALFCQPRAIAIFSEARSAYDIDTELYYSKRLSKEDLKALQRDLLTINPKLLNEISQTQETEYQSLLITRYLNSWSIFVEGGRALAVKAALPR